MNTKSKYNSSEYLNKRYNKLYILEYLSSNDERNPLGEQAYLCQCDCKNITIKRVRHVINGIAKCCDECNNIKKAKSKYEDATIMSKKYGRLKIIEFIPGSDIRNTEKAPAYICECDCGNIVIKRASHVIKGNVKSCGKCHEGRSKYCNDDYIGKKFGKLKVIGIGHNGAQNTFICECECNRSSNIEYSASMIVNGYKTQCDICSKEISENTLKTKRYSNSLLSELINKKFGKLTIKSIYKAKDGNTMARCDCDCGTTDKDFMLCNILKKDGGTRACGCCRIAPNHKYDNTEYIGQTFNGLTVFDIKKENNKTYWKCRCNLCEDHNERWFEAYNVISGNNKSCGCLQSYGEYIIEKALKSRGINYKKQVTFHGLVGIRGGTLRFDFGIYNKNNELIGLIEYDGEQHFKDYNDNYYITEFELINNVNIVKENDKIKNKFCDDNNIQLVRLNGTITEEVLLKKMKNAFSK